MCVCFGVQWLQEYASSAVSSAHLGQKTLANILSKLPDSIYDYIPRALKYYHFAWRLVIWCSL